MASSSPPLFQANALCQLLNDYGAPKFPITWNYKTKAWNWTNKHKIPIYIHTSLIIKGSIFVFELVILIWSTLYPGQLNLTQHVCNVLSISLMVTTILLDYIVWKDGPAIATTTRWTLKIDHLVNSLYPGGIPNFREISYIFVMTSVIFVTAFCIFIVMFLVAANLDPLYLLALCFARDWLQNQLFKRILKIGSFTSMIILAIFGAANIRTLFITTGTHGLHKVMLLRFMLNWKPTRENIRIYREMKITTECLASFSYKITIVIYGACFILICAAVNGAMVGNDRGIPMLSAFSLFVIGMSLIALHFLFAMGGALFVHSRELLWKWKEEAGRATGSRAYVKRVVKGLPVISMICGDFGIVDKDIKMNYLDNLLGCVVDGMMARNNLLNM